jgi:hypothetical protein
MLASILRIFAEHACPGRPVGSAWIGRVEELAQKTRQTGWAQLLVVLQATESVASARATLTQMHGRRSRANHQYLARSAREHE